MLGIFDSGIGGLTVAKEIKNKSPETPLIYCGDTARCPWGNKSQKVVQKYAGEITEFLIKKGAKTVVIACNTASAQASEFLQKKYPEITFYNVVDPIIERVSREQKRKNSLKIGLIGTKGTINSQNYQKKVAKISKKIKIYPQACPLFVALAEEGWTENEIARRTAEKYLNKFRKNKMDFLVLGCTHYPLLKKIIRQTAGAEIISSAKEVAKKIDFEKIGGGNGRRRDQYFLSDLSEHYEKLGKKIMGKIIKFKKF